MTPATRETADHAELARAIERLLPITTRDTPDYAEVSFGECQAQAMTMEPDTWLALNQLPALLSEIAALRAKTDPANWNDREDEWSKDIEAAHPVNSTAPDRHKHFDTAMSMVGNRHGKYALVGLVHWLLTRATQAERQRDELRKALEWYGEQARLARLIHREGDAGRHALADDGGRRARQSLANHGADQ